MTQRLFTDEIIRLRPFAMRTILCLGLILLVGCETAVPTGATVRQLHAPGYYAISTTDAADNSRIRLEMFEAFSSGENATAHLPTITVDGSPMPRYLVIEGGVARLITDYRRHRMEDKPAIDSREVVAMRLGYYERGRFVETQDMPPPGRELILLLQMREGGEEAY